MRKSNIFPKIFILSIISVVLISLTVVFATWFMLSEVAVKPVYNANSLYYHYLHGQSVIYNGAQQKPTPILNDVEYPDLIDLNKDVSIKCYETDDEENKILSTETTSFPTNAGIYILNIQSTLEVAPEGFEPTDILFTINPATPTVTWPTVSDTPQFYSNEIEYSGGGALGLKNETVSGTFAISGDPNYIGIYNNDGDLPILKYSIPLKFISNDSNYSSVKSSQSDSAYIYYYAVADNTDRFFATIDEAIKIDSTNTIYVMVVNDDEAMNAKTIGYTLSKNEHLTIDETLVIPYNMSKNGNAFTYNNLNSSYDETSKEWGAVFLKAQNTNFNYFADEKFNSDGSFMYLKNIAYLNCELNINSSGVLKISGITGNPYEQETSLQGATTRDYAELRIISGSSIKNSGKIYVGGYIKEVDQELDYTNDYKAQVIVQNGSIVHLPFVINDNPSGPRIVGAYLCKPGESHSSNDLMKQSYLEKLEPNILLYRRFDMPNIQTKIKVHYGGTIKAFGDIYTAAVAGGLMPAQHNFCDVTFVAKDEQNVSSIIGMTNDNTILEISCINKIPGKTSNEYNSKKTHIKVSSKKNTGVEGGISLKNMTFLLKAATIEANLDSSKVFFPLSDLLEFEFNNFTYSYFLYDYKILPGCKVIINKGANLEIQGGLSIYSNYKDNMSAGKATYPSADILEQGGNSSSGELIVNGKLIIKNGASIGGKISTTSAGAEITMEKNVSCNLSTEEGWGVMTAGDAIFGMTTEYIFSYVQNENPPKNEQLRLHLFDGTNVSSRTTNIIIPGAYVSIADTEDENVYGWYTKSCYLYYNINGGDSFVLSQEPDINSDPYDSSKGYVIKNLEAVEDNKIPIRKHYCFTGWYLDPSCTNDSLLVEYNEEGYGNIIEKTVYSDTTLYAGWTPIQYNINIDFVYEECEDLGIEAIHNVVTQFDITTNNTLKYPTHDNKYVFGGWYSDPSCKTLITQLVGKNYVDNYLDDDSSNDLHIWGLWYKAGTKTFDVEYVILNNDDLEVQLENGVVVETAFNLPDYAYQNSNPKYSNYFVNWYIEYTDDEKTIFNKNTHLSSDYVNNDGKLVIYGVWEKKIKVVFNDEDNNEIDYKYVIPNSSFIIGNKIDSLGNIITIWHNSNNSKYFIEGIEYSSGINQNTNGYNSEKNTLVLKHYTYVYINIKIESIKNTSLSLALAKNNPVYSLANNELSKVTNIDIDNNPDNDYYISVGETLTFTATANSGFKNPKVKINTETKAGSYPITITESTSQLVVSTSAESSNCITSDTLITLFDGSKKMVKDLLPTDILLVFNHETGKYEAAPMIFNDVEPEGLYRIVNLKFSDGTIVKVVYEHGFFDLTLNEYVYIREDNMKEYIGHKFYQANYDGIYYIPREVELIDTYITEEITTVYSPVTVYHLNYFTEDMLSMPAGIPGLFNIFEFGDNLTYDQEQMQKDIETYGLYTYEDFEDYLSYEVYSMFPGAYLKVSVGKGYTTFEDIVEMIYLYLEKHELIK